MTDKLAVNDTEFQDMILETLSHKQMSLPQLNSWLSTLVMGSAVLMDVIVHEHELEFFPFTGSDVGNVARACYNFAICFQKDVKCSFNGYILEIKDDGK